MERGGKAPGGPCWLPLGRRALAGPGEKVGEERGPLHAEVGGRLDGRKDGRASVGAGRKRPGPRGGREE